VIRKLSHQVIAQAAEGRRDIKPKARRAAS